MDTRQRIGLLGCAVVCAIAVGGCLDADRPQFQVFNRLSEPVEVVWLRDGRRIVLAESLTPGLYLPFNVVSSGECVDSSIIALDESGAVVGTFPGPVCDGTVWEVTPTPSRSPSFLP